MRKFSTLLSNYDSATSAYPYASARNNPGDDTGSSVVATWANDVTYAMYAFIKKYLHTGSPSDNVETVLSSDFVTAFEEALGWTVNGVDEWDSTTTYSTLFTSVTYAGVQWININVTDTNLNKTPTSNPDYWIAAPDKRFLLNKYTSGSICHGDAHPIHVYGGTYYQPYFYLGKHEFSTGDGSDKIVYNAYGLHLDGDAIGTGDLSTIVETWFLKDSFAPGSTGSRYAVDARGKMIRAIDQSGGMSTTMAEVLEDAMQGHRMNRNTNGTQELVFNGTGTVSVNTLTATNLQSYFTTTGDPVTDGTNGTPRTAAYTRDKSVTSGLPYMVIMVEA